jgi:hypothetical protein
VQIQTHDTASNKCKWAQAGTKGVVGSKVSLPILLSFISYNLQKF